MKVKIITHEKTVFEGEATEVIAKSTEGEFGILENHVPCMKVLDICVAKILHEGGVQFYTIMGGILQFKNNEVLILTDIAECSDEIDCNRAQLALNRAEERLAESRAKIDAKRAEAAKARAMARLKASMSGNADSHS